MNTIFKDLVLAQTPIVDVRAPIEFQQGAIPHSINLPILNDLERQEIGTIYKKCGSDAAVQRGYELVSGDIKSARVLAWKNFVQKNPTAVLTCFRGGMRSQISQQWLKDAGCDRPRIVGGYKAFRQYFLEELDRLSSQPMQVISGATGAGKTLAIREIQDFCKVVDLEKLAHHRGSAFGGFPEPQPTQINFENMLSSQLIHLENQNLKIGPLITEDESRMIGRCVVPEKYFESLRESALVFIDEDLDSRVEVTYQDYILARPRPEMFAGFEKSLQQISNKLGGLRFQEVFADLQFSKAQFLEHQDFSSNRIWIRKLLDWYYDPLYFRSLKSREPKIIFRGSRRQVIDFLKS